jgi:tRNA dimethylallyltransferase
VRRTRRFAGRQGSWFRRDPRIGWLGAEDDPDAEPASLLPALAERVAAEG